MGLGGGAGTNAGPASSSGRLSGSVKRASSGDPSARYVQYLNVSLRKEELNGPWLDVLERESSLVVGLS